MARVILVGEAMLELRRDRDNWRLGYGGDTLNTAIHLARARHTVAYLTAIGADAMSAGLKTDWAGEGLDVSLVLDHPTRATGLYAISLDPDGERSFTYWRDTSAARELFALTGIDDALERARAAELLAFSLISVAILPDSGREALLALAKDVRGHGGRVAFDGNYRPRLWSSSSEARHWRDRAIACADFGLPTREDERAFGLADADAVADHWRGLGCGETVVKLGAAGCRLPNGEVVAPERSLHPVDTSGAGDAFNAGYLGAGLDGASLAEAAQAANALAAWTIMRPGAIPPIDN